MLEPAGGLDPCTDQKDLGHSQAVVFVKLSFVSRSDPKLSIIQSDEEIKMRDKVSIYTEKPRDVFQDERNGSDYLEQ